GDGDRRPGGPCEPAIRPGDPAGLRAPGPGRAGEHRLPRDAALRAADARRAADAVPRHLAGVAAGGDRARSAVRVVVPGGADPLRAAGDGRSDTESRQRAVPGVPRELRSAGALLSRPGDLSRATP